jgi:hypothetical protein
LKKSTTKQTILLPQEMLITCALNEWQHMWNI